MHLLSFYFFNNHFFNNHRPAAILFVSAFQSRFILRWSDITETWSRVPVLQFAQRW